MRFTPLACLLILSGINLQNSFGQNAQKGFLEQGFEYFFETGKYEKASRVLDSLYVNYDLKSVKLDYAIKCAVKFKQKEVTAALLRELNRDFNTDREATATNVGAWLGDTTFSFAGFFGKKWGTVSNSLMPQKQLFVDNLKSDYYGALVSFLNVDQFVRFNSVSIQTFNQVDSINLDNFSNWLIEHPKDEHIKSRLNNQIIVALLRHIGSKRFATLSTKGVFETLLSREIISAQDYGLIYDYVHPKPLYFFEYDAFVEKNWAKTGIKSLADLKKVDQQRTSIGLLPLEYCGFCIQKKIEVPDDLKYAEAVDFLVFKRK